MRWEKIPELSSFFRIICVNMNGEKVEQAVNKNLERRNKKLKENLNLKMKRVQLERVPIGKQKQGFRYYF